jgi:hypothetical protein
MVKSLVSAVMVGVEAEEVVAAGLAAVAGW